MKIAIISGKGGTGKTTISTNLAYVLSLKHKVMLIDADVEEPNSHLFFNIKFEREISVNLKKPVIDMKKCTLCRKCVEVCQFGALIAFPKSIFVYENLCKGCGACKLICPTKAISERSTELGIIKIGSISENLKYAMGLLNIGELSGVKIIRELKNNIPSDIEITIIDAPPGASCPVVEALVDTDFAILVTEPTPFGLSDLKMAVSIIEEMKIPSGIIVNRYTKGSDIIHNFAKEKNIPIISTIFFDREIAKYYSKGEIFSKHIDKWQNEFIEIYDKIQRLTNETNSNN